LLVSFSFFIRTLSPNSHNFENRYFVLLFLNPCVCTLLFFCHKLSIPHLLPLCSKPPTRSSELIAYVFAVRETSITVSIDLDRLIALSPLMSSSSSSSSSDVSGTTAFSATTSVLLANARGGLESQTRTRELAFLTLSHVTVSLQLQIICVFSYHESMSEHSLPKFAHKTNLAYSRHPLFSPDNHSPPLNCILIPHPPTGAGGASSIRTGVASSFLHRERFHVRFAYGRAPFLMMLRTLELIGSGTYVCVRMREQW
jgi:hypothetical protein